jgi:excisionase family DNA binding protein
MDNNNELAELINQLIEKSATATSRKIEDLTAKSIEKDEEKILFVNSLAEYLDLKVPTIYAMTSKREIPFYKKGKKLYFKKSEIEKWLETGRVLTNSELEAVAERLTARRKNNG